VLEAIRDRPPREALAQWLEAESVPLARLGNGWNLASADARRLAEHVGARVAAGTAFASGTWSALRERLLGAVAATHEREPEMPGVEQNRLRRMVAPALAAEAFGELVDELLGEQRIVRRGAFLGDPAHKAELGKAERVVWERIRPLLLEKPFEPPRVRDIGRELKIPEGDVRSLLRRVARVGEITLVAHDHFFDTTAVRRMADITRELNAQHGAARAADFRDRIGTGRKVAIQILEFFDRVGYTRRVRDDHLVRRDNPWRRTEAGR
jgi:selenocysteine-specific elongation factor